MQSRLGMCGRDATVPATGVERFAFGTSAYEFTGCEAHLAAFQCVMYSWIQCATPVDRHNLGDCSRCLFPTPATTISRLAYKRGRYALPLCEQHADRFTADMISWARCGTILDTRPAVRRLRPTPQPAKTVVPACIAPEPVPAAPRWNPSLPIDHDEWTFTSHAQERANARQVTQPEALWAATCPDVVRPGRTPNTALHIRGDVHVVVEPTTKTILTVVNRHPRQEHQHA